MIRKLPSLAIVLLAFGCSSSERDVTPWPVVEPEVSVASPDEQNLPVILRASEDDPFYGRQGELYADLPAIPQHSLCEGLVVNIELPFEHGTDPVVLLPRTMTHTAETFGFETKEINEATWVWESDVGPVWATTRRQVLDPFGPPPEPRLLSISSYPYSAESTPAPPRDENGGYQLGVGPECGLMPLDQAESMILPPQEFDLVILMNGTRSILHMRAESSEAQNPRRYMYRETR